MKAVWQAGILMLAVYALQGCDVAAKEKISGDPINGNPDALDPEDDGNIVAYFYTDRPVEGLRYACSKSGTLPIVSKTDSNGSFVCPRDRKVTFYVGNPVELPLGDVDLEIFGRRAPVSDDPDTAPEADARERVTITPSTLAGTTADASNNRVSNTFNLLYMLDTSSGGESRPRIILNDAMHEGFSAMAASVNLDMAQGNFGGTYDDPILLNVHNHTLSSTAGSGAPQVAELRHAGDSQLYMTTIELQKTVNAALRAARAGIYRFVPTLIDFDDNNPALRFQATLAFMVGRNGQFSGMGAYWRADITNPGAPINTVSVMSPDPGAVLNVNGVLQGTGPNQGIVYRTPDGGDFEFKGRLVNDRLYATQDLLTHSLNYKIPADYGYSSDDIGEYFAAGGLFNDNLTVYRDIEGLPDVDFSLLGSTYLPREFGILYKSYPDGIAVTGAQRVDDTYLTAQPLQLMYFRVLPNGDIVSDVDADCANVADYNGTYRDDDGGEAGTGSKEYVIGQVGTIFKSNDHTYMTFVLANYEASLPEFGFQAGMSALDAFALDPLVIDISDDSLHDKRCDPTASTCDYTMEWFNTNQFYVKVFKPVVESGQTYDPNSNLDYLRKVGYYGKILGLSRLCTP